MLQRLTAETIASASIAIALLVLALKALAWWMTGSIALFSDAMESLVNIGGAIMAWFAVRYANVPLMQDTPLGTTRPNIFRRFLRGS